MEFWWREVVEQRNDAEQTDGFYVWFFAPFEIVLGKVVSSGSTLLSIVTTHRVPEKEGFIIQDFAKRRTQILNRDNCSYRGSYMAKLRTRLFYWNEAANHSEWEKINTLQSKAASGTELSLFLQDTTCQLHPKSRDFQLDTLMCGLRLQDEGAAIREGFLAGSGWWRGI